MFKYFIVMFLIKNAKVCCDSNGLYFIIDPYKNNIALSTLKVGDSIRHINNSYFINDIKPINNNLLKIKC